MTAPGIVECPHCGQKNRIRPDATAVPHCGRCGRALPWVSDVHAGDFRAVAQESPLPVLIDFWAPWCGPCRMVEPAVRSLAQEMAGKLKVVRLNTDEEPDLAARFGIRGIPTLLLMAGGREQDRVTGALTANALRQWIEPRLTALRTPPAAPPH